jgi:hypothetical protein
MELLQTSDILLTQGLVLRQIFLKKATAADIR